jgi:hypothetical protein
MNDQPNGTGSAPLNPQSPKPETPDSDQDEFAAFLEEEHATPPPAPVAAKPTPPPPVAAPKPAIRFNLAEGHRKQHNWQRQPVINGTGACRVKSFRGKFSDQGLEHLDDSINEWLDAHPEVEVKFVTSTVASFEGKTHDPVLVLNLWH